MADIRARILPALIVALLVGAGGLVGAQFADFDGDGLALHEERSLGTDHLRADTDGDRVGDGDEHVAGTDPRRADTDGDGLSDGEDVARGGDPLSRDTDDDGILDADEPGTDCDGDGIHAIGSSDDDGDGRPDVDEPMEQRCDPDVDGDGVLDGHERHPDCIVLPDCDMDDLLDRDEPGLGTDPLRGDTFGIGFPDPVGLALGGTSQGDNDGDGIPDDWETNAGPIGWGPFTPRPGQTDLLVEFIRVTGPDSARYDLALEPAISSVVAMFAQQGITLQWSLTTVHFQQEHRPDFLTPEDIPHFRAILENATSSTNPYVTSVILNPQQVQQHVGHILGAAFLRNMVATVDLGAHTVVQFKTDEPQPRTVNIRPIIESHIQSGNPQLVRAYGFNDGGLTQDGRVLLIKAAGGGAVGYSVSWHPEWFRSAPLFTADNGQQLRLLRTGHWVENVELATTIAHELGHTLGLCHTHDAACRASLGIAAADAHLSTMSYTASDDLLAFLPQEWDRLKDNLRCPPQTTAALVAQQADASDILAAKYDAAFTQAVAQRECRDFVALETAFTPQVPTHRGASTVPLDAGTDGAPRQASFIWITIGAAAVLGAIILLVPGRRPERPQA